MKLLLTSNGLKSPELEQAFLELTGHRRGLKIAFIPTAGDPIEWVPEKEGDPLPSYIAKLKELNPEEQKKRENRWREYRVKWEEKGHTMVVVDLKEDPAKIQGALEDIDVIEVGGGDANWLLDWAKKARLNTYLKELLERGVVYVGASAGSCLLIPDIGLDWWGPEWKLDHVGFGIVDFLVSPHNEEAKLPEKIEKTKERRAYMQSHMPYPWKVYLLQDGQAIKVDGDTIEHIGPGVKESIPAV